MNIANIHTLVFDCDGVILDSNRVKTEAFRSSALPYGDTAAQALVDYHTARGGISRYEKFRYFLEEIVPSLSENSEGPGLVALLDAYALAVREGLMSCAITQELETLRAATPGVRWMIVSGGDQAELREIFETRNLSWMFDSGIFGSPDSKDIILEREIAAGTLYRPALFLGDSRYDHEAATRAGLDFMFITGWTEMADWKTYMQDAGVSTITKVADLI